jgi:lipopolysaccharide biosynthesis glycosyltransferase
LNISPVQVQTIFKPSQVEKLDPITIVVATDNFYAVLLSVLLKSIEVNHKTSEQIIVHIIDDGISLENIDLISKTVSNNVFQLLWHKTADVVPANIILPNDKSAFPITTYLRLFAPYLIPVETTKMIYLDVDMILLTDISKLWNIDLGEKLFGAVVDLCKTVGSSWGGIPNFQELDINPESKYFNAGMMLINPQLWRDSNISNKVIKAINDNIAHVNFADQYGLNVVLVDKWLELDYRWNYFSILDYEDAYLIHFLDIKPIFKSYNANKEYFNSFHSFLKLTPYKNFKLLSDYRRLFRKAFIKVRKKLKQVYN